MNPMKINQRDNEELFVYYYDGKPMSITQAHNSQWRPPKKIFYKLGVARANPPCHSDMRKAGLDTKLLTIVRYAPTSPKPQVFDTYHPECHYICNGKCTGNYKINMRDGSWEYFDTCKEAQKHLKEIRKEQEKYDMEAYNGRQ